MPSPEEQELETLISQLAQSTSIGLVPWKAANPTTFVFDRVTSTTAVARITLQRIDRQIIAPTRMVKHEYVFQAVEIRSGQTYQKLSVTSSGQPSLTGKLEQLYQLVSSGLSRQGLDFLKKIIPES